MRRFECRAAANQRDRFEEVDYWFNEAYLPRLIQRKSERQT